MTDREAMKMALEALERGTTGLAIRAIPALRQALAQPEQTKCPRCGEVNPAEIHTCSPQIAHSEQEPVAWYLPSNEGYDSMFRDHSTVISCTGGSWEGWIPLYTAPPSKPWVDLSDEKKTNIASTKNKSRHWLVWATEAALRSKNNG